MATAGRGDDLRASWAAGAKVGETLGALAVGSVRSGAGLREKISTAPHSRLVCVHLQALPFLAVASSLTAIQGDPSATILEGQRKLTSWSGNVCGGITSYAGSRIPEIGDPPRSDSTHNAET